MADYDTNIERKWKMYKHIVNTFSYVIYNAKQHIFFKCFLQMIFFLITYV